MSRVLIFTSLLSWNGIDYGPYQTVKDNWKNGIPAKSREIVECVLDGQGPARLQTVEDLKNVGEGIYLVYDKMCEDTFERMLLQYPENDTFILVHDHGKWTYDLIPNRLRPNSRRGLHENTNPLLLYRSIYLILADEGGDKMERVLDVLGFSRRARLRKAALTFMSGCMIPYNGDPGFLAAKDLLSATLEVGGIVRKFYDEEYPNITKMGETPVRGRDSYRKQFIPVCDVLNKAFRP